LNLEFKLESKKRRPEKQARTDDIVGESISVRKRRPLQILDVDNQMVRKQQLGTIRPIKATRDTEKVKIH
jgi:methylmalonyl-CoA mutase